MKAVILAGGLGTRLKPFTDIIPKPLLPFGEKSLMEIQIEHLKKSGFEDIYIAVNYKSDYVKAFFGDGSRYGVNLYFSEEEKPLGTAGPVKLLEEKLHSEPFLVINGDILTNFAFKKIYDFSLTYPDSPLTIGTKIIVTPFRFGKIISSGDIVINVEEKPELEFEILAGIYVMKPEIFRYIPFNEYYNMDQLIKKLLSERVKVTKYVINDYWIDIGVVEDYSKAREMYENMKKT